MDPDLDKRLTAIERSLADAASSQRVGLVVSLGLVGYALYRYFFGAKVIDVLVVDCDEQS